MPDFLLMGKIKGIILSERSSGTENHNSNLFNKKISIKQEKEIKNIKLCWTMP